MPTVRWNGLLTKPHGRRLTSMTAILTHKCCTDRLAGKNQSWGILWNWAVFQAGGLVLHPRHSLVWQGGFDGTGVHSGQRNPYPQPPVTVFTQDRFNTPIVLAHYGDS